MAISRVPQMIYCPVRSQRFERERGGRTYPEQVTHFVSCRCTIEIRVRTKVRIKNSFLLSCTFPPVGVFLHALLTFLIFNNSIGRDMRRGKLKFFSSIRIGLVTRVLYLFRVWKGGELALPTDEGRNEVAFATT